MNLDHTPHPLVEDHYHIRDLINSQEKRTADRQRHQQIEKNRDPFMKWQQDFKEREILDFWCDHCKRDFVARAQKQIDAWGEVAYYKIKHRCGTWCIRHITHRDKDPYFFKSKRVAMDRRDHLNSLIQPFETGFNMLYGKK